MSKIITGLDIGSSYIKCVVASPSKDGSLSIVTTFKQPSEGFRRGVVVEKDEALRVIRRIILDIKKISKKAADNIYISINGEHIRPRMSQGIVATSRADQKIQQEDIDRVLQASEAGKLPANYRVLHNIVSEYFVDDVGEILNPEGMVGSRLAVDTLIMETFDPHFNALVDLVNRSGGNVSGVVFGPIAASEAVATKHQKDLGVLCIDIGFGTTSLTAFEEGKIIHSKSIAIGSGHITNDIAICLKIPIGLAEKLKTMYGYAVSKEVSRKDNIRLSDLDSSISESNDAEVSRKFLADIIQVRVEEMLGFVNNELKDAGSSFNFPAGVVFSGGGSKLAGIEELAKEEMKLPTRLGYPDMSKFEVINPTHRELIEDPEFSVATGLVIKGLKEQQPSFSFSDGTGIIKKIISNLMP